MTADEIKAKIGFTTLPGPLPGTYIVTASLTFSSVQMFREGGPYDREETFREAMKENMREAILRNIFDDQRREMAEALNEFMQWHQPVFGCAEAFKASERLMKAARYQEGKE